MLELLCVAIGILLATVGATVLVGPVALVAAGLVLVLIGLFVDLSKANG